MGRPSLGKNVDDFEKDVASYIGTRYVAALNSGTAALHLAIKLCDVRQGDLVFCSDLTFSASVNSVCYEGETSVFIDSEEEMWNMNPIAFVRAFTYYTKQPKEVIVAHLYGTPVRFDEIVEICNHYDVPFIEDVAENLGTTFKKPATETFGTCNALSLVVLKNKTSKEYAGIRSESSKAA